MADFDEVVNGLECCSNLDSRFNCDKCKYQGKCGQLNRDALELLKECKDRGMRYPHVYENIYDAAAGLESAARYLEFCGESADDSMVEIITERYEGKVKIKFAIGQPNAAQWVWTIREYKKLKLPDLTVYLDSDYDQLKKLYDMLGLGVTGGEITADNFEHAADKIREEYK